MIKKVFILVILLFGFSKCQTDTKLAEEKTESGIKLIYKPIKSTFSGIQINLIPIHPDSALSMKQSIKLLDFLKGIFPENEITVELDTLLRFIDCGQGFENVICPNCGKEMNMEFWQDCMDKAYKKNFTNLTIKTNCCNTVTDLNLLKYQSDCGFAKSIFTIFDPKLENIDMSKLVADMKNISKIDFKIIYSHY